jgi:hypothetical protein
MSQNRGAVRMHENWDSIEIRVDESQTLIVGVL